MLDFFFGFLGIAIIYVLIYFVVKKISSQHYWYDTFITSFIFGALAFLLDNIYSNGRKVFLDNAYYQKTGLHFPDGYYYIDNDLLWVGILLLPIILIEAYIRSQGESYGINKRIFLIAPFF